MAYSNSIEPTLPPDTGEKPSLGASRIRSFKSALIERLNDWIYGMDAAGTETDKGLKYAPMVVQASDPSTPSDSVRVYAKDVSGTAELFVIDESGNAIQITSGGKLNEDVMQTPDSSPSYPLSYDSIYNYEAYYSASNQSLAASVDGWLRVYDGASAIKIQIYLRASTFGNAIGSEGLTISGSVPVPAGYTVAFVENSRTNLNAGTETEYSTQIS